MQLLLISASMLFVSWIAIILGLYFAIKYKEANKVKESKLFYNVTIIGEVMAKISWYMTIVSIVLLVVNVIR